MRKPSYTYSEFKEQWTSLLDDNRASLNNLVAILGGNKSTASKYRIQYELEQKDEAIGFINEIELPKAVIDALTGLNVKKVKTLEEANVNLKKHLIDAELSLEEMEKQAEELGKSEVALQEKLKIAALEYEKALAVLKARIVERESVQRSLEEELRQERAKSSEASTNAAVAKKEVELLKEQLSTR